MKLSAKSPVFVFTAVWIFYVFVVVFLLWQPLRMKLLVLMKSSAWTKDVYRCRNVSPFFESATGIFYRIVIGFRE